MEQHPVRRRTPAGDAFVERLRVADDGHDMRKHCPGWHSRQRAAPRCGLVVAVAVTLRVALMAAPFRSSSEIERSSKTPVSPNPSWYTRCCSPEVPRNEMHGRKTCKRDAARALRCAAELLQRSAPGCAWAHSRLDVCRPSLLLRLPVALR